MESRFELSVSFSEAVQRDLILSLIALLHRLACEECGCHDSDLGGGILLYCGLDTLRFDVGEDISACIPPLAQIDGFRMTFFANPMRLHTDAPSASLYVGKAPGESSASVIVSASTPVRAQELALEIASFLPHSHPSAQQSDQQHIDKKPEKQSKKSFVSRLESFNTVSDAASNVSSAAAAIWRLIRFLVKIFSCL